MGLYVNDAPERLDLAQALKELPSERRAVALRHRFDLDRKLSAAVYLLLKEGLRREYGLEECPRLATAPGGKPFFANCPDIHFNFSHCPQAAVCAIGPSPVGVDVESVAPVDWAVAERVLSAGERETVRSAARPEVAFARFWTMKEALVKLRGEGLDEDRLPDLLEHAGDVKFETRIGPDYVVSVASAYFAETRGKCYNTP